MYCLLFQSIKLLNLMLLFFQKKRSSHFYEHRFKKTHNVHKKNYFLRWTLPKDWDVSEHQAIVLRDSVQWTSLNINVLFQSHHHSTILTMADAIKETLNFFEFHDSLTHYIDYQKVIKSTKKYQEVPKSTRNYNKLP